MYEDVKSENLVAYLIHRGPAEPNHLFRTVPHRKRSPDFSLYNRRSSGARRSLSGTTDD